ncbi:MAG: cell division protein FtsK [Pseudonocardiaceae bacterium]
MNPHTESDVVELSVARQAREASPDDRRPLPAVPTTDHGGQQDGQGPMSEESGPDLVEGLVVASETTPLPRAERPRRTVLPAWTRDREAVKAAVRWAVGYYAHCTAFHAVRLPLYWLRLAARSPIGAYRLTGALAEWVLDPNSREMRHSMTALSSTAGYDSRDAHTYLRLAEHRRRVIRARAVAAATLLGSLAAAGLVLANASPAMVVAATVAGLTVLGLAGHAGGGRVTGRAVDTAEIPRLTVDLIVTALGSLGLGEMNKALGREGASAVRFPAPVTRDGPGFRADVDLPPGVTAGDVIERRDRLASGLRRPLGCVWPETDQDTHAGRLVLWVGDKSLSAAKPIAWPLAKTGRVNIFEQVTIGVDQRVRPVPVTLMYASGIIGAIPRMGKTFLLRLLCLAASLDPRVQLHIYNLKGGADLDPLALVAHRYRAGDDPDDLDYLLQDLRALKQDMSRRYKTVQDLPKTVCPESKATDDLASKRSLGLHPVFVAVDECQVMFEHPQHAKEFEALVTDLVKRGPAVGIMVWLATQRPDSKSIPTGVSANAVLRLCLKVQGQLENDMVLGTSAYKNGTRATMFSRKDRGIALLAGEGEDPVIVRAAYVDTPTAETIAARARTIRATADLLTGHAAGLDPDPDHDAASVLDHLLDVWPADEPKAWCDDLAERLATTHPGTYHGWTGEQVTSAVRPHGLRTIQIKRSIDGRPVNRRGLDRTALVAALGDRADPAEPEGP